MGAGDNRSCLVRLGATLASVLATQAAMAGPPLRRELEAYHIFALRSANLKNYTLNGACNIGVNCEQPTNNSDCGVHSGENVDYGDEGAQLAADVTKFTKGGALVFQIFSNDVNSPQNVTIGMPPVQPLSPLPILGDVDGDANPSCAIVGQQCVVDAGDLRAACGMSDPAPACDQTKPVNVIPNSDCIGPVDENPGNGRCDLKAGTYGTVNIQDTGKLTLVVDDGPPVNNVFTFCNFLGGQSTETIADKAVLVNVTGNLDLRNDTNFGPGPGEDCGRITVNSYGPGSHSFGRNGSINGFFCAPERLMRLGHNNNLTGRFFGDAINADSNDRGFCCPEGDCACFDTFSPLVIQENGTLTLNGSCSLAAIDAVELVCGATTASCTITSQTPDEVQCTVPVIAGVGPHVCTVRVQSATGTFTGIGVLTVND